MIYQIFGSQSSTDVDVMFFVDEIPIIHISHEIIKTKNIELASIYNKPINSNLCIVRDGKVIETFKGYSSEVNNSMYHTYHLHEQKHPNQILHLLPAEKELKYIRTARVFLTFTSRTEYRTEVKKCLKRECDISDRISLLKRIPLEIILTGETIKKVEYPDLIKTLAFQIGQTLALFENTELYTKEDISVYYPELKPYLLRDISADISNLILFYDRLLNIDTSIFSLRIEG